MPTSIRLDAGRSYVARLCVNVSSSSTLPFHEQRELFNIAAHQDEIAWTSFREGVDIHRLYGDGVTGPTAALLRFRETAEIPMHVHEGYEHILVLAGRQRDEGGVLAPGALRNPGPGTAHTVTGEAGCLVLAIYEKPVVFV